MKVDKKSENSTEKSKSHKIYLSMALIYSKKESLRRDFGDSSKMTDWVLDLGVTFHIKPEISDFVPGSLVEMDKYIEVADVHYVTEKNTGQVQISIHDDNGENVIATFYTVLFATNLCDRLFYIIMLMHSGHT